eukprot:4666755-Prymnesium_polylepis.1
MTATALRGARGRWARVGGRASGRGWVALGAVAWRGRWRARCGWVGRAVRLGDARGAGVFVTRGAGAGEGCPRKRSHVVDFQKHTRVRVRARVRVARGRGATWSTSKSR